MARLRCPRLLGAPVVGVRAILAVALATGVLVAGGCGGSSSPGDAIAFVSTRDGDYAVFGMNADGSDQGRLTKERGDTSTPAGATFQIDPEYAPDGKTIAFASARLGTLDLYLMDADGSNTRRLITTVGNQSEPTWSPDGSQLAYQSDENGDHVYVMRADGTEVHRLTKDLAPEIEPAWSPDGAWIAYSRRLPGTEVREIWIAHPDGTGRRRLTTVNGVAYAPAWSPDGKTIAFSTQQGKSHYEIATVGLNGKGFRALTRSTEDAFEPAWSPDGKTIAFSRGGSIVTITADGSSPQVLTDPDGNDSSPDWNPRPGDGEEQS